MQNPLGLTTPPPKRTRFFDRSRKVRLSVYLPLLCLTSFFGLRWLESATIHHPTCYAPGQTWTLPAGAEDVWFADADGKRLHGWFVHARTQPAMMTALYCHGNGGNVTNVGWIAEHLAGR